MNVSVSTSFVSVLNFSTEILPQPLVQCCSYAYHILREHNCLYTQQALGTTHSYRFYMFLELPDPRAHTECNKYFSSCFDCVLCVCLTTSNQLKMYMR